MSIPPPLSPEELPKVLEQLKDVRNEAAELRNFTITFLSLLLYINIIIAGTDAEQILRIAPVTLPFLNVPLPIIGFYGFVPWLLLLFHLYLLVQHYLFSQQLFLFKNTLDDTSVTDDIRGHVRKNLGNLPFLHWMIGRHHFAMQSVLTLITLISLIIWPLVTLLWLQMAILPYHDNALIWVQRASIILDVVMIGWLWPKTLANDDSSRAWWWRAVTGWWYALVFLPRCLLWLIGRIPWMQSVFVGWLWHRLHAPLPGRVTTIALRLGLVITLALSWVVATLPYAVWGYALAFIALCLLWRLYSIPILWSGMLIPPSSLWHTLKATLPKTINASILALGLCATLFLSLLVATLPDSDEEQLLIGDVNSKPIEENTLPSWLKAVDVDVGIISTITGINITTRVAFSPTAWLHEQHAEIFTDEQDYKDQSAKGAKPCPGSETTNDKKSSPVKPDQCLMVQPWFPRNLILRETVLTDDPNIKPELEAKLQIGAQNKTATPPTTSQPDNATEAGKAKPTLDDILEQVRGLDLQGRNFDYADFTESSLPKVNLRYASLKYAMLSNTRLEQSRLNAAHLEKINLSAVTLTGADMSNATMTGAKMYKTILKGANLSGATLTDAEMYRTILKGANLHEATLTGADMSSATLTGADMSKATLTGANLYGATLTDADMSSATLTGADMSKATLTGANLDSATLTGADLNFATLTGTILLIRKESTDELTQISTEYQQALSTLTRYQSNPQALEEEVKAFKERIQHPADFSKAKKPITPCVRADNAKELPDCIAVNTLNETTAKELATVWRDLACDDKTEKHSLARRMVKRAYKFRWFAKPLLQAASDAKTCVGLAWLSEKDKVGLQQIVDEETKKPAQ